MDSDKLRILTDALDYIETHLRDEISQEECARAAYCSLSGLQKLFRYAFHISIGEYVTKRRLSCAARDLKQGFSVLDIAINYGYGSSEAFTRAFVRVWGVTPTEYRSSRRFSQICPKLDFPEQRERKGEIIMTRRFDISELYDYIKSKNGTYVIVFDTCGLLIINRDYGGKAGDAVIRECFRRIDVEAGEDMLLFRIGGDEFALVTGYSDKESVTALAQRILAYNGETIDADGANLAVSMRAGAVMLSDSCKRYNMLFSELMSAPSDDPDNFTIE